MNNESPLHSIRPNSPVDPSVVRVLRALDPIAHAVNCDYFVAGATARDLILVNVHNLRPGCATRDIDFGIAVESWDQFARLKNSLVATGEFESDSRMLQRLIYSDHAAGFSIPIDLIPFRGVASTKSTIEWPPSRDIVMNVAGFEEALASSVSIEIDENLKVQVASLPGLTLLKLVAWSDRGRETNKDAADLYRLLTAYADAGNTDRLYDHESDLLEAVGFDMELAGAELLGRDVASACSAAPLDQIRFLMKSERELERLTNQMIESSSYAEARAAVERTVNAFCRGLLQEP
jgi:predicted nucleotidyltransferase